MKLPRDLSGERLVRTLERLGYETIRQKGSHLRMRHPGPPKHSVTIPLHKPIKTGTLDSILVEVASFLGISVEDFIGRIQ